MIHGHICPESLVLVPEEQCPDDGHSTLQEPDYRNARRVADGAPMRAAIAMLDYMSKCPSLNDRPTTRKPWVAPEVWESRGEHGQSYSSYSYQADVWSLAVCWLHSINPLPWHMLSRAIDRRTHFYLCERVSRLRDGAHPSSVVETDGTGAGSPSTKHMIQLGADFYKLLLAMLEWDPCHRLNVAKALYHPAWKPLVASAPPTGMGEEDEDENIYHPSRMPLVANASPTGAREDEEDQDHASWRPLVANTPTGTEEVGQEDEDHSDSDNDSDSNNEQDDDSDNEEEEEEEEENSGQEEGTTSIKEEDEESADGSQGHRRKRIRLASPEPESDPPTRTGDHASGTHSSAGSPGAHLGSLMSGEF